MKLFPVSVVPPPPLRNSLVSSLLTRYVMIGNIFVQSWQIWSTFHTASHNQTFPLLGYDLKNVLTILGNFPECCVQKLNWTLLLRKGKEAQVAVKKEDILFNNV